MELEGIIKKTKSLLKEHPKATGIINVNEKDATKVRKVFGEGYNLKEEFKVEPYRERKGVFVNYTFYITNL